MGFEFSDDERPQVIRKPSLPVEHPRKKEFVSVWIRYYEQCFYGMSDEARKKLWGKVIRTFKVTIPEKDHSFFTFCKAAAYDAVYGGRVRVPTAI